jgi:hypothetical protein
MSTTVRTYTAGRARLAARAILDHMPRLPRPFPPIKPAITPEIAEINARVHMPKRDPSPTEAELALALVAPSSLTSAGVAAPWMPQPGETMAEYAAFQLWLDSDLEAPKCAAAKRWAWTDRKCSYILNMGAASTCSKAVQDDLAMRASQLIMHICFVELSKFLRDAAANEHPASTLKEVVSAFKNALQAMRLLRGESTENVSIHDGSDVDLYESMTDAEFAQVAAIKAAAATRSATK